MNKFFTKIASAVLGLAMAVGVGAVIASNLKEVKVAEATEEVVYTLEPATGSNNGYASNCDITIDGITWNLTGNSTMQPWRIGGKKLTKTDRALYSKTALDGNVSKIVVTHGTASSVTVNSFKLVVASDVNFTSIIETKTIAFKASEDTEITPSTSLQWTKAYYKFVYNVTIGGSSNKYIQFTRAKFYSAGNETTPTTFDVTFDENGGSEVEDFIGIESTSGLVFPSTTKSNNTFSGWKTENDETLYLAGAEIPNSTTNVNYVATWKADIDSDDTSTLSISIAYSGSTTNMTGENDADKFKVSSTDWNIVGYKNKASNNVGLNKDGEIRLYGHANGGNYLCVNALNQNINITEIVINLTDTLSTNYKVYEGDSNTSGSDVSKVDGKFAFNAGVTGFTIINTNSGTTQVRIKEIIVYYEEVENSGTTYSVEFDSNGGSLVDPLVVNSGETFEFPSTSLEGHTFKGWKAEGDDNYYLVGQTSPAVVGNIVYVANWEQNENPEPDPEPDPGTPEVTTTITTNIAEYADKNKWTDANKYNEVVMDHNITVTASSGGSNTGKYYENGENWRIYQSEPNASLTISSGNGKTIVSVKITYASDKNGVLTLNDQNVESATLVNVNDSSITFKMGNTGTATNGQARITEIEVIYEDDVLVIKSFIKNFMNFDNVAHDPDASSEINNKMECGELYEAAKAEFNSFSRSQKTLFCTNTEIENLEEARDRLSAWARANGDELNLSDYSISAQSSRFMAIVNKDSGAAVLIVTISLTSVAAIGGYFFLKKRKEQ